MNIRVLRTAAIIAAAAFVAVVRPLPAHSADDAAALLAKHAAYVGQPKGLALTYRYERTAPATPDPAATAAPAAARPYARTTTTYRRGALYREVYDRSGVTSEAGFTGRAFWSANHNGYTVVNLEDAARSSLTANLIDGDLLGGNVEARSRGTQTVDGIAVDVVRVTPASGVPAEVSFDRATGAYVQIAYDPDDRKASKVRIGGYTEIAPGIRVPTSYHSDTRGRWVLIEHAVREVTNADLRGPVPTPAWDFASTETSPIEIVEHQTPWVFLPRGRAAHIRATIGGRTGTFLLDSGASGIIVYRPYADKVGLTMLGDTAFSGVNGGGVAARYARAASITVGKNTLSNVIVSVADGKYAGGLDGILGYDFLAGAIVDVDTAQQTIRILDPSKFQPVVAKGAFAFPINLAERSPEITLQAGRTTTRATVDTGNDFLAILSDDLKNSGRLVSLQNNEIFFTGVDGVSQIPASCSRLNELVVGPYRYQNVETCFASASVFGRDGGLIGFDFLRHFNWTFDYAESKLVLTPNGN
jgi:predicted aspartyl protease